MHWTSSRRFLLLPIIAAGALCSLPASLTSATPMENDPKGFEGIPWGAAFSETADFALVEDSPRVKGYELKQGPPPLGSAKVDSMRFLTVDGQFGRVTIRYHGTDTHKQIIDYFQTKYGPLDKTPGQIAGGAVKFFNWRGTETEINLRYEARTDQGIIFFESQTLSPKFNEGASDTVY